MSNVCFVTYNVVGDVNEIQSLYRLLSKIESESDMKKLDRCVSMSLKSIVKAMGCDVGLGPCRGYIDCFELENDMLVILQETDWDEQEGWRLFYSIPFPVF